MGKKPISMKEAARRRKQHDDTPHKARTQREDTRDAIRGGAAILFDPHTTYRLEYKLSVPPGVFGDPTPSQLSGAIVAEDATDIGRGILVKILEQLGYTRQGNAVSGFFAEMVNPMSVALRASIAMQIQEGSGLDVRVDDITSCSDCGAEADVQETLDPNAEDETKALTTEDNTVHAPACPTHPRPDVEGMKAAPAGEADSVPLLPGKDVEWRTGPAVMILHPRKYVSLFQDMPQASAPAEGSEEGPPVGEIPAEALDKELSLPS